jgi:2-oxo-4-hydroxy-4-carboxy--5-ureidoimidazoline (OHCU) decarboxylase
VRELPRQLTADELAALFEGRTALVERLAEGEWPLDRARDVARGLSEAEKREVLDAHPAIGARTGLSARSAAEQGSDVDPGVLAELAALNREYEQRFGFRFVVFVNRRPRRDLVPVLRERLARTREEELETAVDELVSIAIDRWRTS